MEPSNLIPRQSLQSGVLERLRHEIIEGLWKPGVRLQERLLCQRYGISRSPLREAYQVLASEALLDLLPNRGAVVSAPTVKDSLDHFSFLRAIECFAIELACENASDDVLSEISELHKRLHKLATAKDKSAFYHCNNEVHRAIVCAGGNQAVTDAHLINSRQLIRIQNLYGISEHPIQEALAEHDAFMKALLARQKKRAASELRHHFDTAEDNLRARLEAAISKPRA
jgi:DNA-binding GntR family transcriptional regulator